MSTNPLVTVLGSLLVLPLALVSVVKELRRDLRAIRKNEYPVCRNCNNWREGLAGKYCREMAGTWLAEEYCSKWEEKL